jgi:hypothetical protein
MSSTLFLSDSSTKKHATAPLLVMLMVAGGEGDLLFEVGGDAYSPPFFHHYHYHSNAGPLFHPSRKCPRKVF